ncbi:MAG: acetyl-CoA carboxylase biotin carboxyl carrier protein [Vicinamibacterales bacterium]
MTLDEIKQLIEFIRSQELSEFEWEQDGARISIKIGPGHHAVPALHTHAAMPVFSAPVASPTLPASPDGVPLPVPEEGAELAIVKSPIVGTFYRAAESGAKDFVSVGDTVRKGQVLCIIEAMKLMNEIDSEYDGEVVSVYVENGQPVQYGERLFAIRPAS